MEMEKTQVVFNLPLGSKLPEIDEYQQMLRLGWVPLGARYEPFSDPTVPRHISIHFERIHHAIHAEAIGV